MVMKFPGNVFRALTFSYDDGTRADVRLVSIMKKYGFHGTFNLNSGCFSKRNGDNRLSAEEAKELYVGDDIEVAVHGLYHRFLQELHPTAMCYEVMKDRENLESVFGGIIRGMAYAYGTYNDAAVEVLKNSGIAYSRTTVSTEKFDIPHDWLRMPATCHHKNPRLFELADAFLAPMPEQIWHRKPRLFYVWGHSYEFDRDNNWEIIEKFGEKIGGRDDVWYATNIEIYDYVKAYESLITSCDAKLVYNPSAIEVFVYEDGVDYCIKPGETVKLS